MSGANRLVGLQQTCFWSVWSLPTDLFLSSSRTSFQQHGLLDRCGLNFQRDARLNVMHILLSNCSPERWWKIHRTCTWVDWEPCSIEMCWLVFEWLGCCGTRKHLAWTSLLLENVPRMSCDITRWNRAVDRTWNGVGMFLDSNGVVDVCVFFWH